MTRILLVEDDINIIKNLTLLLQKESFDIVTAKSQKEALERIESDDIDIILLDLSLPDGSGYAVCAGVKKSRDIPVIFLTASADEANVVAGFEMGADDYITKPFRPLELISRIRSVLRRAGKTQAVFRMGNLEIDTIKGVAYKNGNDIFLTALEYRLLLMFVNNKGQLLTRGMLMESLWDVAGDFVNDNTLTVYIKRLREKVEDDPQRPEIIKTVRGMGYRLD